MTDQMDAPLQERFFLLLADETEQTIAAKKILHSPLELANGIVELLFEMRFDALKDALDSIKTFAAGISRAEETPTLLQNMMPPKRLDFDVAYGTDRLAASVFSREKSPRRDKDVVGDLIRLVGNWDDLWIAYALASSETNAYTRHGVSNVRLLEQKMRQSGAVFDFTNYAHLCHSIDRATLMIAAQWFEDTLHVHAPSEQLLYIRDLIYLRAIYVRFHSSKKKIEVKSRSAVGHRMSHFSPLASQCAVYAIARAVKRFA